MSHMLDEIHQQPDVVAGLVESERKSAEQLAADMERRGIDLVIMAARGTSDHAAIYGKYLLEVNNALPVALADCSIFTLYSAKLALERALVIGISQSGEATDVGEYLKRSRELGALTAAITNEPGSTLTRNADHTILCRAGKELGVAATKTYTATLAAFYMLSAAVSHDEARLARLSDCADAMRSVLALKSLMADTAERYKTMGSGAVVGRGFNYCTALETALKLAETSYIGMRGYSAADFLHGPVATVDEGYPCILIAPPGKAYGTMFDMAGRLRDLRAETITVSSDEEILSLATTPVGLEVEVDEQLSPLVYIVPCQLFAYYLAVARGHDPDNPRGLSKVTLTR